MTNLNSLKVSLTKHGAHKIAMLLQQHTANDILNHLLDSYPDINIDAAQARKNLSVRGGAVPGIWDEVRALGVSAINALVLISIIFSHRDLIRAMRESSDKSTLFQGRICRGTHLDGKAYTNFAHTLDELGFSRPNHPDFYVEYNLEPLFEIEGLNAFAAEMFRLKLRAAKWNESTSLSEELARFRFHEVFSISQVQFFNWLRTGNVEGVMSDILLEKDVDFFAPVTDFPLVKYFHFKCGHNQRQQGTVEKYTNKNKTLIELRHNEMQEKLYEKLVAEFGLENVGTELSTGFDSYIDVVVSVGREYWFYEIKTADTVKGCIRQALPQLMEYAYWNVECDFATKLIVVGPIPLTTTAGKYLDLLRTKFNLPIHYEHLPI